LPEKATFNKDLLKRLNLLNSTENVNLANRAKHTDRQTDRLMMTLKMHDLKMTDKENYGSGKCRSTSLVEFNLPIQCTSKKLYAIHFQVAQTLSSARPKNDGQRKIWVISN